MDGTIHSIPILPYFYSRYYLSFTQHQVFKHEVAEEFGDEERLGPYALA